jgi:hypothetical protein
MRKALTAATAAAMLLGFAAVAAPATAEDTAVTFELTGGFLEITQAPTAATLTAGALTVGGSTVSGALGSTTVTDERGALLNNATVTMSSTAFSNAVTTIPATAVTGYSGVATPDSGTTVPVATTAATAVVLGGTGGTILTMESVGTGSASYDPTVSVAIPTDATAGSYSGTITQTAS